MTSEYRLRSYVEERWGASIIPEDMTIQDYPVTYDELEPYFDRFERVAGISGKAGNIKGEKIEGGNPFEAPRSRDYPMPPMPTTWDGAKFGEVTKSMGYHPFPRPGGIASQAYVNEYGMQMGPCNHCGFCERYGCYNYSKSSPQTAILDALKRKPNFEYRPNAKCCASKWRGWQDRDRRDLFRRKGAGRSLPACRSGNTGCLSAAQRSLMLLSGIGQPYDPNTGEGVTDAITPIK